jgi:hypothetical protein
MKQEQFNRLKQMTSTIWSAMIANEQEQYYNDIGTIGFVDDVSRILYLDVDDLTDEQMNEILKQL